MKKINKIEKKIKIISDGNSYNTHVYLFDGKRDIEIPFVKKLEFIIDAGKSEINSVKLEISNAELELNGVYLFSKDIKSEKTNV